MRRPAIVALGLLVGCGAAAPAPEATGPSPPRASREPLEREYCAGDDPATVFTCDVGARIRQLVDGAVIRERSAFTIVIETPDGEGLMQANLDNLWHGCRARPDDCEQAKSYYAAMAAETVISLGTPVPVERARVRAILKNEAWVTEMRAASSGHGAVLSRPFVADIAIVYVLDMPNSVRALTPGDLRALGVDEGELHEIAMQNLTAALPDVPHSPIEAGSTIHAVSAGDSYEASRLLLHDHWRVIAAEVDGDLVAAAPSRDVVLFAGAGRADDLDTVRTLAAEMVAREPYPVSGTLLRWTAAGWEPLAP
jgi:hypothetical protein